MEHAWCRDTARDAAVRAAEDNRTQPLPTLAEAIARPFADAAERSSTVSETGEGQSGMRTQRVTLEVTHNSHLSLRDWPSLKSFFDESVRVVDTHAEAVAESVAWEGARDAYRGRILRLTEEREELKARVAELEAQTSTAGEASCVAPAASGGWQQNVSDGTLSAPAGDRSQNGRLEAASGGGDVPHG